MRYVMIILFLVTPAACSILDANPVSGAWYFSAGTIFDDSCNYPSPPVDPNEEFLLSNNGDGTMTLDRGSSEPFNCSISGTNFTCDERKVTFLDAAPMGIYYVAITTKGTFKSNTSASGHEAGNVTCEGDDCESLAEIFGLTFPCSCSRYFTASH